MKKQQKAVKNKNILIKVFLLVGLIVLLVSASYLFIVKTLFRKNEDKMIVKDGVVQELELSLGSKVPSIDKFIKKKNIKGDMKIYYDDWLIESDTLNEVGTYQVVITTSDKEYYSTIIIKDTTSPTFEVSDLTIGVGQHYDASSFVKSCVDNSNRKCTFYFSDEKYQNYTDIGTYDIKVIARDDAFNEVEKNVKLTISEEIQDTLNQDNNINNIGTDTKIEDNVKETYKYGVKVTTKESVYYEIDQDGNKTRIRSKVTNEVDRENYNVSINDLLEDARKLVTDNKEIINTSLDAINKIRKEENISLLEISKQLNEMASIRALEIAWSGNFTHTRPNGKSSYSISRDLNYDIVILGENIAKSRDYSNIGSVLNYWKSSLGSYKNIINSKYQNLGVGMVEVDNEYYWVLLFS